MNAGPRRLILDVDTGVDDAMALALAVASPDIELIGVTTVAGNVGRDRVIDNTLRVLDWCGGTDVPVYPGAAGPLIGLHRDAAHFHGLDGLGGAPLPPSARSACDLTAPEYIVRAVRASPGDIDLVFVGPLTNLAIALRLEPALPALVRKTAIMGGAFLTQGNETPYAEFNIYADPEAARLVAESRLSALWVGLDVTRRAGLTRAEWDALGDAPEPAAVLVREVSRQAFVERRAATFQLHDPLALLTVIAPEIVTAQRWAIEIDVSSRETSGRSRLARDMHTPCHWVALDLDESSFRERFDTILGLRNPGR